MIEHALKTITIIGGGSSGWMTATFLNHLFNKNEPSVKITLIESKDLGILGVGEATVHSIRYFFRAMGLDEQELMRETQGTFKTGILFRNWMKPVNEQMHEYFHPFDFQQLGQQVDVSTAWVKSRTESYADAVCLSSKLMQHDLSPKINNSRSYEAPVAYGYHLDAVQMARFLKRKATEAGVIHVEANVTAVEQNEFGISKIITDQGGFTSDIYVDCTGFKGLLINQLAEDNWISYEDALPCNKAVAIQREFKPDQQPRSYTTATALTNGWVWEIDLNNRQGTGYVYDGSKLSREEAELELKTFLGDGQSFIKTTHLDMNIGRRKEFWLKNCICIGLSGGFIEPLESTGLHLINIGSRLLSTHLTGAFNEQVVRNSYNRLMAAAYEDLKKFIVLHYCLTDRDDSEFWLKAQRSLEYCPELQDKLSLWKHKVCEFADLGNFGTSCFTEENYRYVLYGMGYLPNLQTSCVDEESSIEALKNVKMRQKQLCELALSHKQALEKIHFV